MHILYKRLTEYSVAFIAVAEHTSFSKAARTLRTSVPALSNQIKSLEEILGKKLLYRTTREVSLTREGEVFLNYARYLIKVINQARDFSKDIDPEPQGTIKVMTQLLIKRAFLDDALLQFLATHPKINLELSTINDMNLIAEGNVDISITGLALSDSKLMSDTIEFGHWGIFAAPTYLAKYGQPQTMAELKKHNCLVDRRVCPNNEWMFAQQKRVRVSGNYSSDKGIDLLNIALKGLGLFWFPKILIKPELAAGQLIEIPSPLPPYPFKIHFHYNPGATGSNVRLFADFVIQYCKDLPISP